MNQTEKEAKCYNELKLIINRTQQDLLTILAQGNPHNLPDPKLQLQITNYMIATIKELENINELKYDQESDTQLITTHN
jgi:hypothetical protein